MIPAPPSTPRHLASRPTRQAWAPLSDESFAVLLPYLLPRAPQGRPLADLRARMDAMFYMGAHRALPWKDLPPRFGRADTVHRHFRRLTHAGLWQRLLEALAEAAPTHPLRRIEPLILRACRRANRLLGLPFNALARRLGFSKALDGPPWLLPNPLLSETLTKIRFSVPPLADRRGHRRLARLIAPLRWLLRAASGRKNLPRCLRLAWP